MSDTNALKGPPLFRRKLLKWRIFYMADFMDFFVFTCILRANSLPACWLLLRSAADLPPLPSRLTSSWPELCYRTLQSFSVLCRSFSVWWRTFSVWCRSFSVWCRTFSVWCRSFSVWSRSFSLWYTRFLISKFLITKFLITKFLITKFLSNKVPKLQNS